jgi:uncharacterized protein YndB with AHSA1/START domain
MATTVSRTTTATPDRVFAQLADGWIFAAWVVGASHIRDVSDDWPALGAQLHHKVGPWPLSLEDSTEVVEIVEGERLVLSARAKLLGTARVELTIEPHAAGSLVTMSEAPVAGLGKVLDNPVQRYALRRRNVESLNRLATLAERRPRPRTARSGAAS